jgi:hypothetical protein
MNCLDIQRQLTECSSYSQLHRSVQSHVEHCVECQGFYPTKPALRSAFDLWPEIEPDARLLASVRHRVYEQMEKRAWGFLQFDFFPSFSFAAGVAVLLAVLGLPLLWMGANRQPAQAPQFVVVQPDRIQVQTTLVGPFQRKENPLVVTDPLTSLHRAERPPIQPGSVVHVIYPFSTQKQPQRSVVHY